MKTCSLCNALLPDDAPGGLCPRCLIKGVLSPGDQIRYFGRYELIEEAGLGGMGVVWRARQTGLDRLVALKMIRGGVLANPDDLKRFQAEAQAAAQLQHPNIVAIHEVGEHEGQQYYSMDFVEGKNLADLCGGRPRPAKQAAELVATIADAVQFAHQRGILHRDLKPQNVMIDASGAPHLTDFGLAKRMDLDSGLTQTGAVMGSPSYMAPEQAQARHDRIGTHTDVYSLGAILYELLTGRPPFKADSASATLIKVSNEEPDAPRKLNPDAPVDLETICLKCLEKSPQRRYATARDLAEDLGRFLKHEPICARPVSASRKIEQWAKRHPMFLAAVAALAFLAVSSVAYGLWQENRYLVWHAAHPDAVRAAGERTAHENTLYLWSIYLSTPMIWALLFFNKPIRRVPVGKMFDAKWLASQPKIPMSLRAMAVYEIIGLGSCVFAFYDLAKLIDAQVWESYSRPAQYSQIYCLLYFGAMILWRVHGERHAQLFGRDAIATDAGNVPADLGGPVLALLRDNKAVDAITLYRRATGCNLDHAAAVVGRIAQHNGVPVLRPAKLNAAKLIRNLAITAAALTVAFCLLPQNLRGPALILFFGAWVAMAVMLTAFRFKGFVKNILPILAVFSFIAAVVWEGRAAGALCAFFSISSGLAGGCAFIKTAGAKPKAPAGGFSG